MDYQMNKINESKSDDDLRLIGLIFISAFNKWLQDNRPTWHLTTHNHLSKCSENLKLIVDYFLSSEDERKDFPSWNKGQKMEKEEKKFNNLFIMTYVIKDDLKEYESNVVIFKLEYDNSWGELCSRYLMQTIKRNKINWHVDLQFENELNREFQSVFLLDRFDADKKYYFDEPIFEELAQMMKKSIGKILRDILFEAFDYL
jgi:phosphopantothenoylcysteine synthetase/decarboxylase